MPIVPMPERQVGTAPLPDVRVSPNAPSAAFPGAVNTGVDVSGAASVLDRVHQEQEQRANQVTVLNQVSGLIQAKNQSIGQLWQARGVNAIGMGDQVQADFRDNVAKVMQTLSPAQQLMFKQHAIAEGLDLQATVQRHVAAEVQRVTDETYHGADAQIANDAAQHATDAVQRAQQGDMAASADALKAVDTDIFKRTEAIKQYAKQIGTPDVARDAEIAKAVSQTRFGVFQQMSTAGQDLAASAYFNKYRGDFVGNDLMNAERIDDLGSVRGASQRQSDDITAHATSLADALKEVQDIPDPRVRDATEQRVRRHFEDQAADERQSRADAWAQASAILEKTKDASQIPLKTRMALTPEENDALDHREDMLRHPKTQTNLSIYTHLTNLSSLNDATRAQFNTMDLSPYRAQLSDEDYKHFLNLQRAARNGEDRQVDAATRRVEQRDESGVFKAAAAAQKATAGSDALRARMKAQGKSDADIDKIMSNGAQPKAPSVAVPQWMVDSAAHDSEYADYLRAHGVPIAQPSAAAAGASAAPPLPPALNPHVNPFDTQTTPAPPRPRVPGAPMPTRGAVLTGPAGLNLTPAPPARRHGASRTF